MNFMLKTIACLLVYCGFCHAAFNTTSCGVTKMCVWNTPNCNVTEPTCLVFSFAWDSEQNNFLMEMSGGTGAGSQYHGVGFSPSGAMEDADVYFCTGSQFRSAVIRTRRSIPVVDANLPAGLTSETASTDDGVAMCTFRRAANITKEISGGEDEEFNLLTTNYYVIQAFGEWTTNPQQHASTDRWASPENINFRFPSTVTDAPTTQTTPMTSSNPNPAEDCGKMKKRCYSNPMDCTPGSSDCMFVSWVYDSMSFKFELIGGTGLNGQYTAVAFAPTNQMENADLYYCTATGVTSGVIRARQQRPTVLDSANDVRDTSAETYNGVLKCAFTRSRSVVKEISNQANRTFDLVDEDFYILYAVGQTANGGLTRHSATGRSVSDNKIDFHSGASNVASNLSLVIVQVFATMWLKSL